MPEQTKYASFATEDLKEQGNLFDNVNGRVTAFMFTKTPPPNYTVDRKDAEPIFAILSLLIDGDAPVEERSVTQSYSLGATAGAEFAISDDGYGLIPLTEESVPRKGSKFTTLTESFQKHGIAATLLKVGNFSMLIGLYAHWQRITDPPRNFSEDQLTTRKNKGSKFPASTLCLTKVLSMPGETSVAKPSAPAAVAAAPGVAAAKGKGAVAAAAVDAPAFVETGDLDTDTIAVLTAALNASKTTDSDGRKVLQRGQLTLAIGRQVPKNPNRTLYSKRAFDEGFLTELAGMGIVVYGQTETGQPVALPAA